jgi:GGDEF domain-containing protein
VSVGVTIMDWESGQTLDELLATADRCMYERKRIEQSSPMIHALPVD